MSDTDNKKSAIKNLRLDIVYDNNIWEEGLTPDWGFGCLIRGVGRTVLFDTGAKGDILLDNMKKMNIAPKDIELIFISHDHWDHTGGLADVLKQCQQPTVYMLKAFSQKTKDQPGITGAELKEITTPTQIGDNLFTTGEMGADIKEQALVLNTQRGLVIVNGCAHPGIVEITRKVKEIFKDDIFLIIGGFHLVRDSEESINAIIEELKKLGVQNAAPCHCSGDDARRLFKKAFGDNYIEIGVGKTIDLSEL
ncbi:MAG: MBL fold metallo-hydrolase [candidate division Zixibacteria bacterium]|nr:MBL fold metallo-hydrolase [candidate division Zixibacteria bacterium]